MNAVIQRILTARRHSIFGEYQESAEKYFFVTYFIFYKIV